MIRTILCPVDLTELSRRTVRLAGILAERLGARVVLHHNVDAAPPSPLAVAWMWSEDHEHEAEGKVADAAAELQSLFAELPGLEVEARLTRGPLDATVHQVARGAEADLLVISTHGSSSAAHDSETEQLVLGAPCPVLALGTGCRLEHLETTGWLPGEGPMPVVVPTDFTRLSRRGVSYALALADEVPLELHLAHALGVEGTRPGAADRARIRLEALCREAPVGTVEFHVLQGRPAQVILEVARVTGAPFVLMAAHRQGPLRRAVFGTTTLAMLHGSHVPVWFVPEGTAGSRIAALLERAVE